MGKFNTYPAADRLAKTDILLKDTTGSTDTRKITGEQLASSLLGMISADMHRNVYRGKNLGTSLTASQKTAISSGTFDDIFIGDYWTIGGKSYAVADMDYWYNHGDTAFAKHHLVLIPTANMYNAKMNETNITTGAYVGSAMYTGEYTSDEEVKGLTPARTEIATAFGENLLTHREYLENAVTDDIATVGAWVDSTVDLMSETMVYGHRIRSTGTVACNSKSQLALFRLKPNFLGRSTVWLRDVVSAAYFAYVGNHGLASYAGASTGLGVRPVFAVGV